MSKRKPSRVYRVEMVHGMAPVYVLARHQKGAAMVAHLEGLPVSLASSDIREVDESYRPRCINYCEKGAS
jgi:hypothetical protein